MSQTKKPEDHDHIVFIGNQLDTLVRFRLPLMRRLLAEGYRVTAMCPAGSEKDSARLADAGVRLWPLRHVRRSGLDPIADVRLFMELVRALRRLRPTHLFSYFIKPVVYGTLAARYVGIPRRLCLIEGSGYAFAAHDEARPTLKRRLARGAVSALFRVSLPFADHLFVLNRDDERRFLEGRFIDASRLTRLDGIGVDLSEFSAAPPVLSPVTFTFAGRLIAEKGIGAFIEAARALKARYSGLRFLVLGGIDDNPTALSADEVQRWVDDGVVEWPGKVDDVRPWLAETSVFVLPSRYPEGLPRTIMEAMATGRPVITSAEVAGCRDSVTDGTSGFVVPLERPGSLVEAMAWFVEQPPLIETMGGAARREAEHRYDVDIANQVFLAQIHRPSMDHEATPPSGGPSKSTFANRVLRE